MEKENLRIAYGISQITLNKGEQHMILTEEDMAFIAQSVLRHLPLRISLAN